MDVETHTNKQIIVTVSPFFHSKYSHCRREVPTASSDGHSTEISSNISPHKAEAKLSLSEYHTARSLSSSGEDTPFTSSQEKATPNTGNHIAREMERLPTTSTPIRQDVVLDTGANAVGFSPVSRRGTGSTGSTTDSTGSTAERRKKSVSFVDPLDIRVPLVGFEVMEQRAKFTVSFSAYFIVTDKVCHWSGF